MRRALRKRLLPTTAAVGFSGATIHFMRLLPTAQDLLSIQYWEYGGSFVLEFGRRPRGPLHTSWGPVVPEAKLDVAYLPVGDRARLQDRAAPQDDVFAGFSFAGFGEDTARYEALATRVASYMPQVEAWLSTRVRGPDVFPFSGA